MLDIIFYAAANLISLSLVKCDFLGQIRLSVDIKKPNIIFFFLVITNYSLQHLVNIMIWLSKIRNVRTVSYCFFARDIFKEVLTGENEQTGSQAEKGGLINFINNL